VEFETWRKACTCGYEHALVEIAGRWNNEYAWFGYSRVGVIAIDT
jgi:hypothetical protein